MKTPPEGLDERNATAIRRLLPGSVGGRSRLVAPERKATKATVQPPGFEGPLPPWGYAGDESGFNGWHSLHVTPEDALAGTGPYLHFGLAPLEDNAVGYGGSLGNGGSTDYWEQYIDDDYFRLEARKATATDTLRADLVLDGAGESVTFSLDGPETQSFDVYLDTSRVYLDMFTAAGNQAFMSVEDDGDVFFKLLPAASGAAWFDMKEGADPPAPPANTLRIWPKDNGAGKTQLMIMGSTGAATALWTQP